MALRAKEAAGLIANLPTRLKNAWLLQSADELLAQTSAILAANARDVATAPEYGLSAAAIDRLTLDPMRNESLATALRQIAMLPDPVGTTIEGRVHPNGLEIRKVRVPLGTVFFIYESRPNVTVDAAAICVKSGNAVILRGGKEAFHSSSVLVGILQQVG